MELHADCYPSYAAVYQPNAKHFLANKLVSRAHVFLQLQVSCSYCTPQRAQIRVQGRTVAVAKHQSDSTSITASQRYATCAERSKVAGYARRREKKQLNCTLPYRTCETAAIVTRVENGCTQRIKHLLAQVLPIRLQLYQRHMGGPLAKCLWANRQPPDLSLIHN